MLALGSFILEVVFVALSCAHAVPSTDSTDLCLVLVLVRFCAFDVVRMVACFGDLVFLISVSAEPLVGVLGVVTLITLVVCADVLVLLCFVLVIAGTFILLFD